MKLIKIGAAFLILTGAFQAYAQALWDDAQLVPASKTASGEWMSCGAAGQSLKTVGQTKRCVKRGILKDVDETPVMVMDVGLIARTHVSPPAGKRIEVVGMLPALLPGANTNNVSDDVAWVVVRFK